MGGEVEETGKSRGRRTKMRMYEKKYIFKKRKRNQTSNIIIVNLEDIHKYLCAK